MKTYSLASAVKQGGILLLPLVLCAPAKAEFIELFTTDSTTEIGGNQTVSYDVRLVNMGSDVVSAYDFGIAYNPDVLTLVSFNGFSGLLGDPVPNNFGFPTETWNQDHLDKTNFPPPLGPQALPAVNSVWDYSAGYCQGAVNGCNADPRLGSPMITGAYVINEGSLRFTQLSQLLLADLQDLQNVQNDPDLTSLFSLAFEATNASQAAETPIKIVFADDYVAGSPNEELDLKYNAGTIGRQPNRMNGFVSVPVPGTLALLAAGLGLGAMTRRRRRQAAE